MTVENLDYDTRVNGGISNGSLHLISSYMRIKWRAQNLKEIAINQKRDVSVEYSN